VRILLDTHVLIWAVTEPEQLSLDCREALEDGANEVYVSAVSAWEIAIKQSFGKLDLPEPAERWIPEVLRASGFDSLGVNLESALRVRALPWLHRDPFDRLLIAQAIQQELLLATRDAKLEGYGVPLLPA